MKTSRREFLRRSAATGLTLAVAPLVKVLPAEAAPAVSPPKPLPKPVPPAIEPEYWFASAQGSGADFSVEAFSDANREWLIGHKQPDGRTYVRRRR